MTRFQGFPEQARRDRLLTAALTEGPAHAYLFHGPPGVGKRRAALGFAGELLGDAGRVERRAHPDLYVLEPLGDQIRIDAIRELRHDLHMRPFEADRRVYLIFGAHSLNDEAADALLKDLEEPPPYAVIVLVADDLGPLPETIPLAVPARSVPAAEREDGPGGGRLACPGLVGARSRPRSRASPADGSTGSTACSTRRRRSGAMPCSRSPAPSTPIRSSTRPRRRAC